MPKNGLLSLIRLLFNSFSWGFTGSDAILSQLWEQEALRLTKQIVERPDDGRPSKLFTSSSDTSVLLSTSGFRLSQFHAARRLAVD